ncbi:hypothetical protein L1987_88442 [Smallanthus sonchifolius]|nr:hypothetical protein L1987_88442 [Smallanthus sonchifolius]
MKLPPAGVGAEEEASAPAPSSSPESQKARIGIPSFMKFMPALLTLPLISEVGLRKGRTFRLIDWFSQAWNWQGNTPWIIERGVLRSGLTVRFQGGIACSVPSSPDVGCLEM